MRSLWSWWKARTRRQKRCFRWSVVLLLLIWFVPWVFLLHGCTVNVTRWEKARGKTTARVGPTEPGWVKINEVSRHFVHALVTAEDSRFYQHHGIDLEATWDAATLNWRKKRYVRGGSTITQQVVKMAFLSRKKSIVRKAREGVGSLLLDATLSKERILEWYVNLAEFGDGIYGIKAAAKHYFQTKPQLLTVDQSIHLALVLPSPNKWSAGIRRRQLSGFGQKRFANIVWAMKRVGFITEAQWQHTVAVANFGKPLEGAQSLLAGGEPPIPECDDARQCPEEGEDEEYTAREAPNAPVARSAKPSSLLGADPDAASPDSLSSLGAVRGVPGELSSSTGAVVEQPSASSSQQPSSSAPSADESQPAQTVPAETSPTGETGS